MPGFTVAPAFRWVLTLAVTALIVVLSITPGEGKAGDSVFVWLVVNTPAPVQKLMHVACYATVAALWAWALEAIGAQALRIVLALVIAVALGAVLEWYQVSIPGRFGTLTDVLLDTLGAVLGLLVALLLFSHDRFS